MKMEQLQIIHSEYFADYKAQQPITIEKRVKRLASKPLTPQNFRFYLWKEALNLTKGIGLSLEAS